MADLQVSVMTIVFGIPERILRAGLDCLARQTMKNAEFILVNDCSPDDFTHRVLREYADRDSRFRIIANAENVGVPAGRNIVVDNAKGKYLAMIDPDDLVPDNYLEILCGVAEYYDCDMVTCKVHEFQDGEEMNLQSSAKVADFCRLPRPLSVRKMFRQKFICRLMKMSTIGDLRFDLRLQRGADLLFVHQYLVRCERTLDLNYVGYFYRHGRIFAPGEKKIPARPPRHQPGEESLEAALLGLGNLFHECRTEEEKEFVAYMAVRRYLRCFFGLRKDNRETQIQFGRKFVEILQNSIQSLMQHYGLLGQWMIRLSSHPLPEPWFYVKVDVLRVLFELWSLGYHIRRLHHRAMVRLRGAA